MQILWYLINRDGRYPWDPKWSRQIDYNYFKALVSSIDARGYSGTLFATQPNGGLDPFVTAASLIPYAPRMRFLLAVHPALYKPTQLAKLASTLDQNTGGRLMLNIVNAHTSLAPAGIDLNHQERYESCDEFLEIYRRIMASETVDFDGKHHKVKGAKIEFPSHQQPYPPLWFGGSSGIARDVAARHIDKYLTWGEPPPQADEIIKDMRQRAARFGRQITFGIRLNLIVRDTDDEAWAAAQDMLDHASDDVIAATQRANNKQDAVSQKAQSSYHGGVRPKHARDLEVYPNLWSGFGLVRNGPGIAIVGSPESVAARILEYRDIGIDAFILSGHPFLEESHRFADQVLPLLPLDDAWKKPIGEPKPYKFPKSRKTEPQHRPLVAAG